MFEDVVALEGDTVDQIAFRRFGIHGMEAEIYAANPGLAEAGPILALGTVVRIPVPGVPDRVASERLWA